jgi:hypothetical protein
MVLHKFTRLKNHDHDNTNNNNLILLEDCAWLIFIFFTTTAITYKLYAFIWFFIY